jgi:putative hydrolase of the HAD superfamily
MIKGYLFDYGGTLDTNGCHWGKKLWHAYERHHVPVSEQHFREAYVHAERTLGSQPIIQPNDTFHKLLEVKLRIELEFLVEKGYWNPREEEFKMVSLELLEDLYGEVCQTTAHSREVLTRLRSHYPMVLVSNFYGNVNVVLREFGLDSLFDAVIESAVVGVRKPDPRIFTLGVEALGMQPNEVVVVGDSFHKDIVPAREAGCHTVWFKGEGWTDETFDEGLPDRVITDLEEL